MPEGTFRLATGGRPTPGITIPILFGLDGRATLMETAGLEPAYPPSEGGALSF
jgi:hypothetical protein